VGEHFGRQTDFSLGTRYEGGSVREPELGDVPLVKGMVFHNTSLYEIITLGLLFLVMTVLIFRARHRRTEVKPATLVALFMVWSGGTRFLLDTLRVNDERALGMTGAQWVSAVMVPYGIYLFVKVRPAVSKLVGADGQPLDKPATDDGSLLAAADDAEGEGEDAEAVPDELEAPDKSASPGEDSDDESDADGATDADKASDAEPEPAADAESTDADKASDAEPEPAADAESTDDAEPVTADEPADAGVEAVDEVDDDSPEPVVEPSDDAEPSADEPAAGTKPA